MDLTELQRNWDEFGRRDPMWFILSELEKSGGRWDPQDFFAGGRAIMSAILSQLQPFGFPRHRRRALDFGCGLGRLTQAACDYFDHVVGIDIAESMIGGARKHNRFGSKCEYVHNTEADISLIPDASIDFVSCLLVLQHMKTELGQGYISEFVRVLQPGGVAVFQVPYASRREDGGGSRLVFDGAVMEMHATPRETVIAVVEASGGRVLAHLDEDGGGSDWASCVYVATRE